MAAPALRFTLVIGNIYRLTIVLSATCGVIAVVLLCRMVPASRWHRALLVIAPLTLSRTFDDWVIWTRKPPGLSDTGVAGVRMVPARRAIPPLSLLFHRGALSADAAG